MTEGQKWDPAQVHKCVLKSVMQKVYNYETAAFEGKGLNLSQ